MPPIGVDGELTDRIKEMKAKGLTNNQIIQTLQREGMNTGQIFEAMNQLTIPSPQTAPPAMTKPPNLNTTPPKSNMMIQPPTTPRAMPPPTQYSGDIEATVEAIIEEKWTEIEDDINKIIEWKDSVDERIARLDQSLKDLKQGFDKLQSSVVGKVSEYDKHIMNVGAEVQAMEKVFSKVLPAFVDNVAILEKITSRIKSSKKR